MKELSDIGLVGLAVMGENLVLNMESKGFRVSVFNRTVEKVDKFMVHPCGHCSICDPAQPYDGLCGGEGVWQDFEGR